MLRGGNPLTVGVGMIIEVIRKNNSDYDPDVGAGPDSIPSSNDPIYLGTLLRCFAKRVPDFMGLLLSPTHAIAEGNSQITITRKELGVAFGNKIEPLGFDRFKTCELMAELLHCSNMGLLNERGSEAFVRQRDEEREKLKAEGQLATRIPPSAATEFSEGSAPFTNGISPLGLSSGSEETRKLEVQNSVDDDGFEDVGNSVDLAEAEDIKDDFDEKSPLEIESEQERTQIPNLIKQVKPRLDLDEDFVDEPLTSPRLEAVDEKEAELPEAEPLEPRSDPEPASATSGLTSGVKELAVNEDTIMAVQESPQSQQTLAEGLGISQDEFPQTTTIEAPPLPNRERNLEPLSPGSESPGGLSPHPEDKPAPLFSPNPALQSDSPSRPADEYSGDDHSQRTIDTTQGEEGDTNRSVLVSGNDQSFAPQFEYDVDGQPIVGDFLKMMFVEHHVVPTILVRDHVEDADTGIMLTLSYRTFSFDFPGIISFIM